MSPGPVYRFGGAALDLESGRLTFEGRDITLRPKAFEFLRLLVEARGRLFSKDELLAALWPDRFASEDSLVQLAASVRSAFGPSGASIVETLPKRGYRLGVVVEAGSSAPRAPDVHYAVSGDVRIAWQSVGEGPEDLIYVPGWVSHLEYNWESPLVTRFLNGLAAHSRLILFDKRGTGLSDRAAGLPTVEQRMDDVRAVMDAAGSKRAAILAMSEGGVMAMAFAARFPERVSGLALFGVFAKREWSADYPWAPTREERQRYYDSLEQGWGGPVSIESIAPSLANDATFREWWAVYQRRSASPGAAIALARMNTLVDVRHLLAEIRAPTLVMHRAGDRDAKLEEARYIAAHIPGAQLAVLPGEDHLIYAGEQSDVLNATRDFLKSLRGG